MGTPLIYYWSSNGGTTKALADKLGVTTRPLTANTIAKQPYVLLTPTYDQPKGSYTPKAVEDFLTHEENKKHLAGVIAAGNRAFGEHYCKVGEEISATHNVPILARVELRGTPEDIHRITRGMQEGWALLLLAANLTPPYPTPQEYEAP